MYKYGFPVAISLTALVSVFSRLLAGNASLAFFDDDFFYYLKIARMLATGHGSTFDGIHKTNGYHPLWQLLLAILAKLSSDHVVIIVVLCLICLSTLLTYFLANYCFSIVSTHSDTSALAALFIAFATLFLIRGGMEIVLSIPLALLLIYYRVRPGFQWTMKGAFIYGSISALLILSRLDAIIWVATLFAADIVLLEKVTVSHRLKICGAILLGLTPVLIYLALNKLAFGTALPISGQAKQLRIHHGFSLVVLRSLLKNTTLYARLLILVPWAVVTTTAFILLVQKGQTTLLGRYRAIAITTILFPVFHMVVLSWLSDWPVWPWYLYSFVLGEIGAVITLMALANDYLSITSSIAGWASASALFFLMLTYSIGRIHSAKSPEQPVYAMYDAATKITHFSQSHPGIYAMGDRAGLAGYLMNEPLLQTEGLVMDAEYLRNIREEKPLISILRQYNVKYFVTTYPRLELNCYLIQEPLQAGSDSHTTHASICQEPAFKFSVHGIETDIFAIDRIKDSSLEGNANSDASAKRLSN